VWLDVFDQLCGYPQDTHAHEAKIIIANFMLGYNESSVCCKMHTDKFKLFKNSLRVSRNLCGIFASY
jgi:hypothetical protein